ncbi:marine proteobacterial sortase target protein [Shewanella sp. AS16]|uniref:marine proteobacterial sortase target protein n=1 Tax=Shewanella sp. AS16 TaxID=2907625 RepID=UPI001F362B34|nr:marine proteobacterial sortase target protein [Shewanella sp. AS16]MCE9687518.1 marine proteobacterial sortase target protein [Shewanella sp. AS16]
MPIAKAQVIAPPRCGGMLAALVSLACLLLGAPAAVAAADAGAAREAELAQGSLWYLGEDGGYRQALPLHTRVEMQVTGLVNRVRVIQSFENPGQDWLNGEYRFPLPNEAAVDALRLMLGERIIEGRIQAKAAARQSYETAKVQGRRASLVTQERPNIFSTEVANLAPRETMTVEISYQETLNYLDGEVGLRFPMRITPRYSPRRSGAADDSPAYDPEASLEDKQEDRQEDRQTDEQAGSGWAAAQSESGEWLMGATEPQPGVDIRVRLAAGFPLAEVTSPYHGITRTEQPDGSTEISLTEAAIANRDFVLRWRPQALSGVEVTMFNQPGRTHAASAQSQPPAEDQGTGAEDEARYALVMLMPPGASDRHPDPVPRELILVMDTSGSMAGDAMEQAKQAMAQALSGLRPQDSFNILAFSNDVNAFAAGALPANSSNLSRAQDFVAALTADGGTEMTPALLRALAAAGQQQLRQKSRQKLRQIIFMTDGAVDNEAALFRLIAEHLGSSRLFTVGIGPAPNSHFMQRAAELGRGSFLYIGKQAEVASQMQTLLGKLALPVVTDIRLEYPDASVPDYWPRRVTDLYRGEPLLISLKQAADSPRELRVSGKVDGQFWQRQLFLGEALPGSGLDILWARKQLAALELNRTQANAAEVKAAVTALALDYHLVSRHTSLVAVELTPARQAGEPTREAQVRQALPWGWQPAPGSLPQTATASRLEILLGALLIGLAALLALSHRGRAGANSRWQG